MTMRFLVALLSGASAGLILSQTAFAGGFFIQEQSGTGIGRAFAGAAAAADDASTIFFNPAGLTHLKHAEVEAGFDVLAPHAEIRDTGSTYANGVIRANGGSGGNPYKPTPVPHAYGAMPLLDGDLWIGVGVTAPFGLGNKYNEQWFARYDSTRTNLKTIDVAPTIAYRINELISIGMGVSIQYADVDLRKKLPNTAAQPFNPATDLSQKLEGDDISLGYNFGVTLQPTENIRLGASYRSQVRQDIEGSATIFSPTGAVVRRFDATADLDTPWIASLAVMYDTKAAFRFYGSYSYYDWSSFDNIKVVLKGQPAPSITPQNYEDSYAFALGMDYDVTERFTLRAGTQYDRTPVQNIRRTTTPDGDRTWLSVGATYEATDAISFDFGYTHIFLNDGKIFLNDPSTNTAIIRAESEADIDIFALNARYRF
jgi:long-chain fatty acid transport protein